VIDYYIFGARSSLLFLSAVLILWCVSEYNNRNQYQKVNVMIDLNMNLSNRTSRTKENTPTSSECNSFDDDLEQQHQGKQLDVHEQNDEPSISVLMHSDHSINSTPLSSSNNKTHEKDKKSNSFRNSHTITPLLIQFAYCAAIAAILSSLTDSFLQSWRVIDTSSLLPTYSDAKIVSPQFPTKKEFIQMLNQQRNGHGINVFGSGYSFRVNTILPQISHTYISTTKSLNHIQMRGSNKVYAEAGVTFGQLQNYLSSFDKSLKDFPGFSEITIGSAMKVKAHGMFSQTFVDTVEEVEVYDSYTGEVYSIQSKKEILSLNTKDGLVILSVVCETEPVSYIYVEAKTLNDNDTEDDKLLLPLSLESNIEYFIVSHHKKTKTYYRKYIPISELPSPSNTDDKDNNKDNTPSPIAITSYQTYSNVHKYGYLAGIDKTEYINGKFFKSNQLFMYDSYSKFDLIMGGKLVNYEIAISYSDYQLLVMNTAGFSKIFDSSSTNTNISSGLRIELRRQADIMWMDVVHRVNDNDNNEGEEQAYRIIRHLWDTLKDNHIKYYVHEGKYIPMDHMMTKAHKDLSVTFDEVYLEQNQ